MLVFRKDAVFVHRGGPKQILSEADSLYRFIAIAISYLGLITLGLGIGWQQAYAQLPALIDLNVTPGSESAPLVRVYGAKDNDQLGNPYSNGLAYGDFDGDGYDDVLVGAFRADPNHPTFRSFGGEAYILFGSALSDPQSINLAEPLGTYGECRMLGDDGNDYFGTAVAAGDINGDGYDDAVIGARGARQGTFELFVGEVYIVYGRPGMSGSEIDFSMPPGTNGETRIMGDDPNDYFGNWVTTGDVNGDGFDDVIVGAHFADHGASTQAGEAIVIYGSETLPGNLIDLRNPEGSQGETRIYGRPTSGFAGTSVASGDINGDGYADILVSAPNAHLPDRSSAGEVFIVFGRPDLPGALLDMNDTPGTHGEVRIWGDDQADELGHSLAVGDVNADGFDDAIIGVRRGNAGNVVVIYGSDSLTVPVMDLDAPEGTYGETRIIGRGGNDLAGTGVGAADINGDGFEDIVLGAPDADGTGSRNGEAYVLFGSAALPGRVIRLGDEAGIVRVMGDDPGDFLGIGIGAGGDTNRDGFADFAATASHGENIFLGPTADREGYAALLYGGGTALSAKAVERFHAGPTPAQRFGGRLSPTLRTQVNFVDGDAGSVTVELNRNVDGISGIPEPDHLAHVAWTLTTTRSNWSAATLEFQYTDNEIAALVEGDLVLYSSISPHGPWEAVAVQFLDTQSNVIEAMVTDFGYFVLADKDIPAVAVSDRFILLFLAALLAYCGIRLLSYHKHPRPR